MGSCGNRRGTGRHLGRMRMADATESPIQGATIHEDTVVPACAPWSARIKKGDRLRLIDLEGQQAVDFLAEWRAGAARAGGDATETAWADPGDLAPYDLWDETLRLIAMGLARRG